MNWPSIAKEYGVTNKKLNEAFMSSSSNTSEINSKFENTLKFYDRHKNEGLNKTK